MSFSVSGWLRNVTGAPQALSVWLAGLPPVSCNLVQESGKEDLEPSFADKSSPTKLINHLIGAEARSISIRF